jgi:hypothetical protein
MAQQNKLGGEAPNRFVHLALLKIVKEISLWCGMSEQDRLFIHRRRVQRLKGAEESHFFVSNESLMPSASFFRESPEISATTAVHIVRQGPVVITRDAEIHFVHEKRNALARKGTIIYHVAEEKASIIALLGAQHGLERRQVAVYVGQDESSHLLLFPHDNVDLDDLAEG